MTTASFFRKHEEGVLIVLGVFFAVVVIGTFIWGIGVISVNVNKAASIDNKGAGALEFNVDAAVKVLQERGISAPQE